MQNIKLVITFFTFALVASSAGALTYDEAIDLPGDFPNGRNLTSNPSVGILDEGVNTVTGTLSGPCLTGTNGIDCNSSVDPNDDGQDSFLFSIAPFFQLDKVFVTTSNVSGPIGFSGTAELINDKDFSDPDWVWAQQRWTINGTGADMLLNPHRGTAPFPAGLYSMTMFAGSAQELGDFSMDYSIEFQVSKVPLPAALPMMASSLLGFALMLWRRRSA